ncbi:HpcH/HpaI aldolase/citrate lyase family protein [Piscinibacter sakaiensis]|uniref:Citrate lyase, beta chain n=1 Tax=Piscinibacter sakaiensis TaxID=1547922 RepID=A0A0K8P3H7_PISS1|nr:CoA ester lyase [Piscinibacter sakaiensis]GAP37197.1 citrate lyase, beta chain [Piscinibacter sakaiensis]
MRSLLFVPGDRPERFAKARAAGASAVVVDLEDAVAPAGKDAARDAVRQALSAEAPVVLRINAAGTPWFEADLALAAEAGVRAVMVPKAEDAATLARVAAAGARVLLPLVETAAGLAGLAAVAAAPRVERLVFGTIDLQADLGLRDATEDDLLPWRLQLVLASRLAGIGAPIDGVCTAIDDAPRLAADVARARRLGFAGKLCIHPRQVAAVEAGFAPSAAELDWARRVLAAAEASGGAAVAVDGKMVDRPVLLRAQAILQEAGH